ncbi:conserved hypothetical protein [Stutzerimonas stutzeri A1501]|uniref:Uncharacterized protein n=1 Tax=Stutzerimonas stutzeri (strain A1501) TaxID=379731 RepID=A4VIE9_STUS1|nr:conserved hypothetical protein [Stutzerimonas stutzeri A1501]
MPRFAVNDGSAFADSILRKRSAVPRCNVKPAYSDVKWVGAVSTLDGVCSHFVVTDVSASGDSILRKAVRRTGCPAIVGWISRRRNPTFEWVGAVAVLGRWMSPFRGKRRKRLWRFHHTESDPSYRDTESDPSYRDELAEGVIRRSSGRARCDVGRWMQPVRGNGWKRLRQFHHTEDDAPYRGHGKPVRRAENVQPT